MLAFLFFMDSIYMMVYNEVIANSQCLLLRNNWMGTFEGIQLHLYDLML